MTQTISREEIQELADLPWSQTQKTVKELGFWNKAIDTSYQQYLISAYTDFTVHDSNYGCMEIEVDGWATVHASSPNEAEKMADDLTVHDFDWKIDYYDMDMNDLSDDITISRIKLNE
jgi:hypothetical protein